MDVVVKEDGKEIVPVLTSQEKSAATFVERISNRETAIKSGRNGYYGGWKCDSKKVQVVRR